MVFLDLTSLQPRDTQFFQGDAMGVQHPEHIVIGDDKQVNRGSEGIVFVSERAGVHVAVRTNQR